MAESTRLAIVQQALADIVERLAECPPLRASSSFGQGELVRVVVRTWEARPPTETARAAMLKSVLDLSVEVMAAGKTPPP